MQTSITAEVIGLLSCLPVAPGYRLPTGATPESIEAAERRIGIPFPTELRNWLQHCNGPCVGPGGLLGINTPKPAFDLEFCLAGHQGWKERGFLPVAGDGCGNYYVMIRQLGGPPMRPIVFIDTIQNPLNPAYVVASDLWHFLRFLFLRELRQTKWPFAREEVCDADPRILNVTVAPPPVWSRS